MFQIFLHLRYCHLGLFPSPSTKKIIFVEFSTKFHKQMSANSNRPGKPKNLVLSFDEIRFFFFKRKYQSIYGLRQPGRWGTGKKLQVCSEGLILDFALSIKLGGQKASGHKCTENEFALQILVYNFVRIIWVMCVD